MRNNIHLRVLLLLLLSLLFSCSTTKLVPPVATLTTINTVAAQKKPYVILISLDGFRWDYVDKYKPPHLTAFIEGGVKATSLIPVFPSKTFPNHYSIATGMYPDNHGIIGNIFYNYEKDATYKLGDRTTVTDGSFYKGTPLWVQANNAGMVTASYFFVGTEANIQGIHPTYYYNYDKDVSSETRVDQAIDWLELSPTARPHFISMYFSDMDNTGHRYGPNNDTELKKSLFALDIVLGDLFERVKDTKLPVQIVIVSDHGMLEVPLDKYIPRETVKNDALYTTIDNGTIVSIHPKDDGELENIFNQLQEKANHFSVYKTKDTPHFEKAPTSNNWGPIQIIPDPGYYFSSTRSIEASKASSRKVFGHHGFDPKLKEMHGIFYAQGSAFKEGYTQSSMQNIHVYPLICKLLGMDIPKGIDGKLNVIQGVLKGQ